MTTIPLPILVAMTTVPPPYPSFYDYPSPLPSYWLDMSVIRPHTSCHLVEVVVALKLLSQLHQTPAKTETD